MSNLFVPSGVAVRLLRSKPEDVHQFRATFNKVRYLYEQELLPYLLTPEGYRLFVVAYMEAYREYLRTTKLGVTTESARAFAITDEAQHIAREAEAKFITVLTQEGTSLLVSEAAALLGVNRGSVKGWINKGLLSARREESLHSHAYIISPAAIRRACPWKSVKLKR